MLAPHDVYAIAVAAFRDPRTVRAVYAGRRVAALSRAAVADAAVRLGYPPPEAAPAPTQAEGVVPAKEATPTARAETHGEPTI